MRNIKVFISVVLVYSVICTDAAKILGVYPMPWGSHYILGVKLMKALAEAGHDVTFITPYPTKNISKHLKWTDVVLDGMVDQFKAALSTQELLNRKVSNLIGQMKRYTSAAVSISNATLTNPAIKRFIESGATFDAVILDQFNNDCHHIFSHVFKGHLILASTLGPNFMINSKVGTPTPVATIPAFNEFSPDRSRDMTILERTQNLFTKLVVSLMTRFYSWPWHEQVMRQVFPDAPHWNDLYYNASLVLLNSHTSLVEAVPVVPNMIEVGGFHIDPPKKLDADLQTFLDSAKDGVIYFSMGSTLRSKDMPASTKKIFIDVFKGLKEKVLWKFEDDLPGKPENVVIKKWMPQQDILAHPNIKLFITHGGLLSSIETVYHGVPVLSIPVFGDQEMNANSAVQGGFGLKLSYHDENFSVETLKSVIDELLDNPKYRENAKYRSKIYHDRPMSPVETLVYWVEYVIRHNGARHLRVAGVEMPWYKYYMVDVLILILSVATVLFISLKFITSLVFRFLYNKYFNKKKLKVT